MVDISRRISVCTEGTRNVLAIELNEEEKLIPYCCKVMESNNIPGLLRMNHQMMDGAVTLRYDLSGKVRLHEFMLQHRLTYQQGILLLRNLTEALLHLDEYFLSAGMCYLNPEQIYIGDGLTAYLPCIPVEKQEMADGATDLKHFYEKLISEYFATADCSDYDRLFKWVYNATMFDLEAFYKLFLVEQQPAQPSQPVQPTAAARLVQPAQEPIRPVRAEQPVLPKVPQKQAEQEESHPHELTEILQSKMDGVRALYGSEARENDALPRILPRFGRQTESHAEKAAPKATAPVAPQAADIGFEVPGGAKVVAPQKKEKAAAEKKTFSLFGGRASGAEKANPQKEPSQPSQPPVFGRKPVIPATPKAPQVVKPQESEEWDSGTILVGTPDQDSMPKTQARPQEAYFVHNGNKVSINHTPFLVGKYNTSCQLHYAIYDNNKISRSHATFLCENGQYFIRDNQSRNGTTLNGQALLPLQPAKLSDGDEIRLYDELLVFHLG